MPWKPNYGWDGMGWDGMGSDGWEEAMDGRKRWMRGSDGVEEKRIYASEGCPFWYTRK